MGVWAEIRVFYELFPFLLLLGFPAIAEILGWKMEWNRADLPLMPPPRES
jgi:hypothetical protein